MAGEGTIPLHVESRHWMIGDADWQAYNSLPPQKIDENYDPEEWRLIPHTIQPGIIAKFRAALNDDLKDSKYFRSALSLDGINHSFYVRADHWEILKILDIAQLVRNDLDSYHQGDLSTQFYKEVMAPFENLKNDIKPPPPWWERWSVPTAASFVGLGLLGSGLVGLTAYLIKKGNGPKDPPASPSSSIGSPGDYTIDLSTLDGWGTPEKSTMEKVADAIWADCGPYCGYDPKEAEEGLGTDFFIGAGAVLLFGLEELAASAAASFFAAPEAVPLILF